MLNFFRTLDKECRIHQDNLSDMPLIGFISFLGFSLILNFPYNELAVAIGIFSIFFSLQSTISAGKVAILHQTQNIEQFEDPVQVSQLNIRVQLTREKCLYDKIAIEQLRRANRIRILEDELANKNPQPFRSPARG